MAQTIGIPPAILTIAHADANSVKYNLHANTRRVTVIIEGQPGDVGFLGTDGGSIGTHKFPVPADTAFELRIDKNEGRENDLAIFVAADAAATVDVLVESY